MNNFWAEHTQPAEQPPAQPLSLGAQYSSWQADKSGNGSSGSYIYSPEYQAAITGQRAAPRPNLYAQSPVYEGLESYSRERPDPLAKRPGESDEGWERRTAVARRLAAQEADEAAQQEWAEHRAQVDNRVGSGTGLYGNTSATERGAALGSRFGGRTVEANGHVHVEPISAARPLTAVEAAAIARQREAEQCSQIPQRQQIPTGSSGEGIFIR